MLDVIQGSLVGSSSYSDFMQNIVYDKNAHDIPHITNPTMAGIATHLANQEQMLFDKN